MTASLGSLDKGEGNVLSFQLLPVDVALIVRDIYAENRVLCPVDPCC